MYSAESNSVGVQAYLVLPYEWLAFHLAENKSAPTDAPDKFQQYWALASLYTSFYD